MYLNKFIAVTKKYMKCPNCGSSWKGTDIQIELKDEIVEISCTCGFRKMVDENNQELKHQIT